MKRLYGNKTTDQEWSVIALELDELDMEIKDLRLQKITLHTNGFNESTKKLDFYTSKRNGDRSLPKKSFRTNNLQRDQSPVFNTSRPNYEHFFTETK